MLQFLLLIRDILFLEVEKLLNPRDCRPLIVDFLLVSGNLFTEMSDDKEQPSGHQKVKGVVGKLITRLSLKKALSSSTGRLDLIVDRIFMGRLVDACNPDLIIAHKISHILSVCPAEPCFREGLLPPIEKAGLSITLRDRLEHWKSEWKDIVYEQCSISDNDDADISRHFQKAFAFIDNVLSSNPNNQLLVHCHAGVSRSSTIVIGYLVHKGDDLDEAYTKVKTRRNIIKPNRGFAKQLLVFHYTKFSHRPTAFIKEFNLDEGAAPQNQNVISDPEESWHNLY